MRKRRVRVTESTSPVGLMSTDPATGVDVVTVPVRSAFKLKLNWAGLGGVVVALLVFFGIDISDADKAKLISAITLIQGLVVIVLRTWFSSSVAAQSLPSPSSLPPLEE